MKKYILILLAFAGTMVWTGCQKNEEDPVGTENPGEQVIPTWTLTLTAGKSSNPQTRALDLTTDSQSNPFLKASWNSEEKVFVFKADGTPLTTLDVAPKDDATMATLSGTIEADIQSAVVLKLLFPRTEWDYSLQYGLLKGENSIEKLFDYALATVTATPNGTTLEVDGNAEFENQQSIFRFSFKHDSKAVIAKTIEISSLGDKIVDKCDLFTPANTTHGPITLALTDATNEPVYAAIRHDNQDLETKVEDTFGFTVFDNDGVTYKGSKVIPVAAFEKDFISAKNISLNRLDVTLGSTAVNTIL